jgi:hypothetical protein
MNYINHDPIQFACDGPEQTGWPDRIPPGWILVSTGKTMAGDYRWDDLSTSWQVVISGRDGYPASNYYRLIRRDPNTVTISAVEPVAETPPEPADKFRLNTREEMAAVCAALRDGVPCEFRWYGFPWEAKDTAPNFESEQWRVNAKPVGRTATTPQLVAIVLRAFNVPQMQCVLGTVQFKIDGLEFCINQFGRVSVKEHHWVKDDNRTKYVKPFFDAVLEGK